MVTTRTLETIAALLFHGGYLKEIKTVFIFCPFVVYAYSCQASWPLYHLAFRFLPGWFDLVWWCCCVTILVASAAFGDVALQIWEVAGARNADFFHTKCPAEGGKVSLANGRVQFCNFMASHVWQVSCILPSHSDGKRCQERCLADGEVWHNDASMRVKDGRSAATFL